MLGNAVGGRQEKRDKKSGIAIEMFKLCSTERTREKGESSY
jgi:hypothetical protein